MRLTQMGPTPKPIKERLLAFVEMLPDMPGCWIFMGARLPKGYGQIKVGSLVDGTRRQELAHRVSYEEFVGPLPDGQDALHKCDVPPCIRPDHLYAGTQKDNTRDGLDRGGIAKSPQSGRFIAQAEDGYHG